MKKPEYLLIRGNYGEVCLSTSNALAQGWQLHGPLVIDGGSSETNGTLYREMIRFPEVEDAPTAAALALFLEIDRYLRGVQEYEHGVMRPGPVGAIGGPLSVSPAAAVRSMIKQLSE